MEIYIRCVIVDEVPMCVHCMYPFKRKVLDASLKLFFCIYPLWGVYVSNTLLSMPAFVSLSIHLYRHVPFAMTSNERILIKIPIHLLQHHFFYQSRLLWSGSELTFSRWVHCGYCLVFTTLASQSVFHRQNGLGGMGDVGCFSVVATACVC